MDFGSYSIPFPLTLREHLAYNELQHLQEHYENLYQLYHDTESGTF